MPSPFSVPPDKDNLENNAPGRAKDIYLSFIKDYFAAFPQGQFRYTGSDTPESDLEILDQGTVKLEVIEKRPAIILQRSPMAWAKIGLDQQKDLFIKDGTRRHTDLLSGTMTLHCIAREGLEAERLSWQLSFALKSHRRELQRRGFFEVGQDVQIGAETPPGGLVSGDTDSHTIDVPVYSPFILQVTWESRPVKSQPFRSVEVRMESIHVGSDRTASGVKKKVISLDAVSPTIVKVTGT